MKHVTSILTCTLAIICLCSLPQQNLVAQANSVGIGTLTPHPSAILHLESNSGGLLVPRMTDAQRDAISDPARGLLVFVSNDSTFYCYEGSAWVPVGYRSLMLADTDGDTRIEVEGTPDDDSIRFVMNGAEKFRMGNGRLEVFNFNKSVYLGRGAGVNDNADDDGNVMIGDSAGVSTDGDASNNTGIGYRALYSNINGDKNSAVGYQALHSNTLGDENSAVGYRALFSNETGFYNTAMGHQALHSNTNGGENSAVGYRALFSNETGFYNTAMGTEALRNHIRGNWNTAIGYQAMYSDTNGIYNTAVGRQAMYSNLNGIHNTAIGNLALNANETGSENTASGRRTLFSNVDGAFNTALGNDALYSNISGSYNLALGNQAGYNTTGDSSVFIGNKAGYHETAGHRLYIENSDTDKNSALIYGEFDNDLLALNADVGIGTASPTAKLHVSGGSAILDRGTATGSVTRALNIGGARSGGSNPFAQINFKNYDNNNASTDYTGAAIWSYNANSEDAGNLVFLTRDTINSSLIFRMTITEDGLVGIGTTSPNARLSVNGQASKVGGGLWANLSDARLKDIGDHYTRGLEAIMQLEPVFYNYKVDNALDLPSEETYVGFIAQEVRQVIPEAIDDSGEYLSLEADPIYLAMLNAIKELKAENDALKSEMGTLKDDLSKRLADLEARVRIGLAEE